MSISDTVQLPPMKSLMPASRAARITERFTGIENDHRGVGHSQGGRGIDPDSRPIRRPQSARWIAWV